MGRGKGSSLFKFYPQGFSVRILTLASLCLIAQLFDFIVVETEVVADLVYYGKSNLFTQFVRIGEVAEQRFGEQSDFVGQDRRIECGAVGQRDSFVEPVDDLFVRF